VIRKRPASINDGRWFKDKPWIPFFCHGLNRFREIVAGCVAIPDEEDVDGLFFLRNSDSSGA
jgi:hypothetical protein